MAVVQNRVILGMGSHVPQKVLGNEELSRKVDTSHEWIQSRTGIIERRIAEEHESTSDLAYQAARKAIDDAGVNIEQIDLVIVATITPDMSFRLPALYSIA